MSECGSRGSRDAGWPSVGGKTVHIDFRGWSRSSKITIVGTWLRCNYRFVFRYSKKAGEDKEADAVKIKVRLQLPLRLNTKNR